MEDNRIIVLFFARDERAITETEQKYGAYCQCIAINILRNQEDSKECVNDTWLQAWNSIPPEEPLNLKVYLGCIVRNLSINLYHRYRAKKRHHDLELMLSELEECIPGSGGVEEIIESRQLGETLTKWIRELPVSNRRLFVQRYWYGDSVKKLAIVYGCSANAMASRIKRLRVQLKDYLDKEGIVF